MLLFGATTINTSKKLETWQSLNKITVKWVGFTESKAVMSLFYMQCYKVSFFKEHVTRKVRGNFKFHVQLITQISPVLQVVELIPFSDRNSLCCVSSPVLTDTQL